MSNFASGVRVFPTSVEKLREQAREIRKLVNLTEELFFPVLKYLAILQELKIDGFDFEIVDDNELPQNTFAVFKPQKCLLLIKNSIYEKAYKNDGFARFVIMHEICHFWLHRKQELALQRRNSYDHKPYEDSEWQANTLAREILAPIYMIKEDMTIENIAEKFGISKAAAEVVWDKFIALKQI